MSEECSRDCSSCEQSCSEKPESFREAPHELSHIKKVIGVVSGKGGVGKSLVTATTAVCCNRAGLKTAILDADITGPSIPRMFGVRGRARGSELGLLPVSSRDGVRMMSLNLLTERETDPVVWRGPIIAGTVKQFWTDVIWDDVDVMLVDMPPGTGDVPLTVFQTLPLDGVVVVASPQELVSMIVEKAVNMAKMMRIPLLGLVENMSYYVCPHCGEKVPVFGEGAKETDGLPVLARIPIDPALARACDTGCIEDARCDYAQPVADKIIAL